jgi:proton-dependent oligopeptide transporter, POT family
MTITMQDNTHPRGLYTLFFTEMWERLSYYGMRALLVLFMVDQVEEGGLGLTAKTATAIYGLYTAAVYLGSLPGGWIADRLLGAQRAIWYGGILIALGHFVLAVPTPLAFYLGLILVVLGTGLLKPNISAVVGQLYPEGGARRDAGFSIFYMGINLGAFIGPLVCSYLGEKINWHWGFAAAGVGMVLGLVQYRLTQHFLGPAGLLPPAKNDSAGRDWLIVALGTAAVLLVVGLALTGVVRLDPVWLANRTTGVIVGVAVAYFAWAFFLAGLSSVEKGRMVVIAMLFVACAMFWAGFEQAGSSLTLFAEEHTLRYAPAFHFEAPAGWFQSLNPIYIILLAPVFAALWVTLAKRNLAVSLTTKMAWGLLLMGAGFLVAAWAANRAASSGRVWPTWLIAVYLVHTLGELCLSPVGLSAVTKLAPPRLVGQMMGIWFLATSLGNLIAGLIAGEAGGDVAAMPQQFLQIVAIAGVTGVFYLALAWPMQRLIGDIK